MVEDAENDINAGSQDALQPAHIGQEIQYRVAIPFNQSLVHIHLNQNPKKDLSMIMNRLCTSLLQSEDA